MQIRVIARKDGSLGVVRVIDPENTEGGFVETTVKPGQEVTLEVPCATEMDDVAVGEVADSPPEEEGPIRGGGGGGGEGGEEEGGGE